MKMHSPVPRTSLARGVAVICAAVVLACAPSIARAAGVVGSGAAASCTDAALDAALAGGGLVTFNCGGAATIDISTGTKTIAADTTIDGGGLITISGVGNSVEVFSVPLGGKFTVQNLTIARGSGFGGGIFNGGTLTVTNSTFTGNSGGGIFNSGTLIVTNSTFAGNGAGGFGGGIFNSDEGTLTVTNSTFADNRADRGGGISNDGTLTVTNSTFSGNSATRFGAGGGGIANGGTATLTNCTLSGNSAFIGGGIVNNGTATLTNCTLSGNSGSGIDSFSSGGGEGIATLTNTIVANSLNSVNCGGTIVDGGHNLSSDDSCFSSPDLLNTDPRLAPLANYGGPTATLALCTAVGVPAGCTSASPAVDAGDDAVTGPPLALTTDQRGRARKSGLHVDIGAYEAGTTITVNDTGDNTTAHDSKCTLREALANVNAADDTTGGDCVAGTGNGDTVVFDLTLPATITLTTSTELAISTDVTISGPTTGALAVDGNSQHTRVFEIMAGTVSLANLTIQNGGGFGIAAFSGGGIWVDSGAGLTLINCTLSGNSSGSKGVGGGIVNDGTATLTNCTLSGNSAAQVGGGIYNAGTATLTNCTLSGNSAPGFGGGGGILNAGTATLTNCTLSGNRGSHDFAGGIQSLNFGGDGEGIATLTNTIVANSLNGVNCGGTIVDGGHNLSNNDSCFSSPGSQNTDPRLAPLANYGGPTETLALCAAVGIPDALCSGPSPAIDAGDPAVCAMAPVNSLDQRGFVRPGTGHTNCSIGAYEADAALTTTPLPTSTATITATPPPTASRTPTVRNSPTPTPSAPPTSTATITATPPPTSSRTPTVRSSPTLTPSAMPTSTSTSGAASAHGGCAMVPMERGHGVGLLLLMPLLWWRGRARRRPSPPTAITTGMDRSSRTCG